MRLQLESRGWATPLDNLVQRDPNDASVGSSGLSPAAVGGIATGGVVGLFIILILIARFTAQKRHGGEKGDRRLSAFSVDDDVRRAMHSAHPPALNLSERTNSRPNYPSRKLPTVTDIWLDDPSRGFKTNTSMLKKPSKAFFHSSRDSWPLISWSKSPTTPVTIIHPTDHTLGESIIRPSSSPTSHKSLNTPMLPASSYSQPGLSTELSMAFERGTLANTMGRVGHESMKPTHHHRRSASDTHLSSILRSTSQRLRDRDAKNGRPLSRAMSSLSQTSGAPPRQKLPSPPRTKNTESREGLMAEYRMHRPESVASNAESISCSLFDLYPMDRTPSHEKHVPWSADDVQARPISPSQSKLSDDDSLYQGKSPDLNPVIIPLSSPSKRLESTQRRVPDGFNEGATTMHRDNRASVVTMGGHEIFAQSRNRSHSRSHSRSSSRGSTDPFYSTSSNLVGPREAPKPTYNRKATFGAQHKTPLSSVSGNNSAHPLGPREKPSQHNPFQWSPEEARRQKPLQVASKPSIRRGHKRQNVVRMSGLPRPPSVNMIPEQPEEITPDRLMKSTSELAPPPTNFNDQTDSPSSVYSRYTVTRPPSVQEFDPSLSLPDLSANMGHHAVFPLPPYSSTLSIYNYYTDPDGNNSEEDFFAGSPNKTSSQAKRRHARDFSVEKFVFDPPLAVEETHTDAATSSNYYNSSEVLEIRTSVQASIGQLRRMNSEVSTCSLVSSRNSTDSTTVQDYRGGGISPSKKAGIRGSRNYLAIGESVARSTTSSPAKKRVRSRIDDIEESPTRSQRLSGYSLGQRESSDLANTMDRNSGLRIQGLPAIPPKDKRRSLRSDETSELLKLYTRSRSSDLQGWETPRVDKGKWDGQQVAQKVENSRWERTQQAEREGVRHESQMKMPSPQGKIKWDGMEVGDVDRTESSLGLRDEDDFLKSSLGRENMI